MAAQPRASSWRLQVAPPGAQSAAMLCRRASASRSFHTATYRRMNSASWLIANLLADRAYGASIERAPARVDYAEVRRRPWPGSRPSATLGGPAHEEASIVKKSGSPSIGDHLRAWRERHHLSQLELSLRAEVSARHLSFVETGRADRKSVV